VISTTLGGEIAPETLTNDLELERLDELARFLLYFTGCRLDLHFHEFRDYSLGDTGGK
jgi:hypothetical protein